jgi:hypothetical protein
LLTTALAVELVTAAEEFRALSGQGHRPWEIRARLGSLEDHIATTDNEVYATARETGRQYDLSTAASVATQALLSMAARHRDTGAPQSGKAP